MQEMHFNEMQCFKYLFKVAFTQLLLYIIYTIIFVLAKLLA